MTTQPQTECVLHDFLRDAVSRLSEALSDSTAEFEDYPRLERGPDGHFREHKKRMRTLAPILNDQWLHSLPDYQTLFKCLESDPVVGRHLNHLVGIGTASRRIDAETILKSLIYAMLDDEGRLAFTSERFHSKWQEWVDFFGTDQIAFKMVAPLPHLVAPAFPLLLDDNELVLDRLTDDEVTRSYQVGVIRDPSSTRFPPLIFDWSAVGIRRKVFLPKIVCDEPHELPNAADEGSFGNRPRHREDLVVDAILSTLRLFKPTQIRTSGFASWIDSPRLNTGMSYRVLGQWPYGGKFELTEDEVPQFLELWHLLKQGAERFRFSIHRFNLAFDRGLLADRIVDLVIAAEALFLSDLNEKYRGELRFRFALRAAKFIEHGRYCEHDVFQVMRRAYDARSAIVHGGSLPDNESADLPAFIDAIEELVRLGLRKALSMKEDAKKLRQSEYWDSLVFSKALRQSEHFEAPRTEREIEAAAAAAAEKANGGKFVDPLFYKPEHRAFWHEVIRAAFEAADTVDST
jgi:hypothetical protein